MNLLPCPFCGGNAETVPYGDKPAGQAVGCNACDMLFFDDEVPEGWTLEGWWNRRAEVKQS
jgi:hypothetical protein